MDVGKEIIERASLAPAEKNCHSMGVEDAFGALRTDLKGLSKEEAERRLREVGPNELVAEKRVSPLKIFVDQFKNILVIILIAATIFSAAIGETVDAAVILVIIIAVSVLGFAQEYRAERALEALKKMLAPTITALLDGREVEVPSRELVPGDVILLEAGDRIPADARLFEVANLNVDEAALTGESVPVIKSVEPLPEATYIADRRNMVFSGTIVTYGKGKAVITSTGMETEFGKIAKEVTTAPTEKTPLERRTEHLGKWLGIMCVGVCLAVVVFGIAREALVVGQITWEFGVQMALFGIALAVAAVPEALPAIVTGALAIGMRDMAKRNALVRKMPAVETLGSVTVICTDKTGTLTKGEMTVRKIFADGALTEVTGVGYEPKGEFLSSEGKIQQVGGGLKLLLRVSTLCNDAKLEQEEGRWAIRGDPTEGALVVAAAKAGIMVEEEREKNSRICELPFSSERKRMTTAHAKPDGGRVACTKGAPEVMIGLCTHIFEGGRKVKLTEKKRQEILAINESMAKEALRVLGIGYKEVAGDSTINEKELEEGITFLGLVGMLDPPRSEAIEAVKVCRDVKIKPVMITGDHKLTAIAIAKEIGIYEEGDMALTGEELEAMGEEELEKIVERVSVYARVSPLHKLKIVKAWKKRGEIVAMTGDGVNDAPAIKNADIGIAMGITGTEVTKEASAMVLADDNFATIVKAIERGRWIFDNIKKYLTYLLQCNLVEIIVLSAGVLMWGADFLPLLPAQILYINLATDGLPALALGVSPADPDVMRRPPRNPKESIFTKEVKTFLFALPLILSPLLLWIFARSLPAGLELDRTDLFLTFVFFELTVALNCRSLNYSFWEAKPHKFLLLAVAWEVALLTALVRIPGTREALGLAVPGLGDVAEVIGICLFVFLIIEGLKRFVVRRLVRRY